LYPDVDIDEAGVKSESSPALVLVGEVTPRFVVDESESDISDEAPEPVVCSPCLSFTGYEGEEDLDRREKELGAIYGPVGCQDGCDASRSGFNGVREWQVKSEPRMAVASRKSRTDWISC